MPAEVESLMYVSSEENGRFVPWHGLGTPVEEALTSEEALVAAGLNWTVESRPIYVGPDFTEISGYKANTRDSDGSVLGIVSDRYRIVQNKEAFDFTDSLIGEGCVYETAGSLKNGKTVFLLAKMPETAILGDKVEPYLCFTNTHSGLGAIQIAITPIRVVCQNTLNLALRKASRKWTTKHIGDMSSKLAEAKYTLMMANDYMSELMVTADKLAHTKVSDAKIVELLDDLFPINAEASDRVKNNIKAVRDKFMLCTEAPDIAAFKNTGWGLVNAASDFMSHVAPARMTETYRERNFERILDGHIILDKTFAKLAA